MKVCDIRQIPANSCITMRILFKRAREKHLFKGHFVSFFTIAWPADRSLLFSNQKRITKFHPKRTSNESDNRRAVDLLRALCDSEL